MVVKPVTLSCHEMDWRPVEGVPHIFVQWQLGIAPGPLEPSKDGWMDGRISLGCQNHIWKLTFVWWKANRRNLYAFSLQLLFLQTNNKTPLSLTQSTPQSSFKTFTLYEGIHGNLESMIFFFCLTSHSSSAHFIPELTLIWQLSESFPHTAEFWWTGNP